MSLPRFSAEASLYKTREYYGFATAQTEYLDGQGLVAPTQTAGGSLMGAFCMDGTIALNLEPITLYVAGQLVQAAPPMGGRTQFSVQVPAQTSYGPQCIGFNVSGLQAGTWNVSARASTTGIAGCQVRVPGMVQLGVSGGQGPWCHSG